MNQVSLGSKYWGSDDTVDGSTEGLAAGLQDAADFKQWLHAAPQAPEAGTSSSLGGILNSMTSSIKESEHAFDKSLKRAGKTSDPVEMLAVSKHLSETYLLHGLAVKVIGKTTQALESLTKLQ